MKDHVTIEGHDGTFAAYIARPKTLPAPAIVVLLRSGCRRPLGWLLCRSQRD